MCHSDLSNGFCITKMGAESGEAPGSIVLRKSMECELEGGFFCWGIGNNIAPSIDQLTCVLSRPPFICVKMKSRPKRHDVSPSGLIMWTAYLDPLGQRYPLPPYTLVTSRVHDAENEKHYALFLHSSFPLQSPRKTIELDAFRNFSSGKKLGASQVTSVSASTGKRAGILIQSCSMLFWWNLIAPFLLSRCCCPHPPLGR
jgi:hypothetical protein